MLQDIYFARSSYADLVTEPLHSGLSYILDQMILGRMMREATEDKWGKGSDRIRRMVKNVAKEAEQSQSHFSLTSFL